MPQHRPLPGVGGSQPRPLAPGNAADFVVLAEDPLTCDEDRIKDIRVEHTFVDGREVFTAPD